MSEFTQRERAALAEFGRRVISFRLEAQITQAELVRRSKLSRATIAGIEAGTHATSWLNVLKLAAILGIAPRELLP